MATSIRIDYVPKPKQQLFHESSAVECFFGGAKGPGKSCSLTMEAVAYALEYPESRPYLFRRTFDDLEANLIDEFKRRVPQDIYSYDGTRHIATLINGSQIYFRYVKNWDEAKAYKGRSISWIGMDELTEYPFEVAQELLSCNRSAEGFPVRFRATSNPGNVGHQWVKQRYVTPTQGGKNVIIDPVTGNTIQFIPATVYDGVLVDKDPAYVRRLENLPEIQRNAYLHGSWDIYEGQFFDFDEYACGVKPFNIPMDSSSSLWGSLDHGISHNTSFGLWWLAPDLHIYRLCSYSSNGGDTDGHATAIWDLLSSFRYSNYIFPPTIYFDPAMNKKAGEKFARADIDVYRDVFKNRAESKRVQFISANNRKIDGCHAMKEVIHDDGNTDSPILKYFIPYNRTFVDGLKRVLVDPNNSEVYKKDDGDDEADEARYGVMAGVAKRAMKKRLMEEKETDESVVTNLRDKFKNLIYPANLGGSHVISR